MIGCWFIFGIQVAKSNKGGELRAMISQLLIHKKEAEDTKRMAEWHVFNGVGRIVIALEIYDAAQEICDHSVMLINKVLLHSGTLN